MDPSSILTFSKFAKFSPRVKIFVFHFTIIRKGLKPIQRKTNINVEKLKMREKGK